MRGPLFLLVFMAGNALLGQGADTKTNQPFGWDGLRAPFDRDLNATVSFNHDQTLLFKGDRYALLERAQNKFTTGTLASLPGWPKGWKGVDAAARWTDRSVILFNQGYYLLYDLDQRRFSDQAPINGWSGWPSSWADGIDAALPASDSTLYLFRGDQYLTFDKGKLSVIKPPQLIRNWKGWPLKWFDGIDSADNPGDGYLYFFRGVEFLVYDLKKAAFVKGYPKPLPGVVTDAQSWPPLDPNLTDPMKSPVEWKGLPSPFNEGIHAIVSLDKENALLFKAGQYVLYTHTRDAQGNPKITTEAGAITKIPGWPASWKEVHAAAKWGDSSVILFHEGKYMRYSLHDRKLGPEKDVTDFAGWPDGWSDGIDAALADEDGDTLYFFRGSTFITFSKFQQAVTSDPAGISDWNGFPLTWMDGIDGADSPGDGRTYFFRGREVLAWDNATANVLPGYPKVLPGAPKLSPKVWPPVPAPKRQSTKVDAGVDVLKFTGVAAAMHGTIDAGVAAGGNNILLFSGGQYGIYNTVSDKVAQVGDLSSLLGWPKKWTKVDAAASWDDLTLTLFSGGEFVQYNTRTRAFRGDPEPVTNIPYWPPGWTDGINGAANLDDDTLYLLHGSAYVTLTKSTGQVATAPQSAKMWVGWPLTWSTGPTAMVEAPDGLVYFFSGSEFLPYDPNKNAFVASAPIQLAGTAAGTIAAAWPPAALPPGAAPGPGSTTGGPGSSTGTSSTATSTTTGTGGNNFVTDSAGNVRVTSIVPLNGGALTGINATALNLVTTNGTIPISLSDPAYFDLNLTLGSGGISTSTGTLAANGTTGATQFRDDYPVNNDFQWEIPWVSKGADYLGAGYDPLTLNPANYGDVNGRAPYQAVKLTQSFRRNLDGTLAAYCSDYSPGNTGHYTSTNTLVSTLAQYQSNWGIDTSVSLGIEGVGKATVGGGYSELNNQQNGATQVHLFRQSTVGLLRIRMDPTCTDVATGQPYRQKLNPDFRNRVDHQLPDQPVAAQELIENPDWIAHASQHIDELKAWRDQVVEKTALQAYTSLLKDYGYWLATSVTLGGQYRAKLTINKSFYEKTHKDSVNFTRDVEANLDGVEIGSNLTYTNGHFTAATTDTDNTSVEVETSGGTPSENFESWAQTVATAPAPISAGYRPLSDFIGGDFFPDHPQAADNKALVLKALILVYAWADGPPVLSSDPKQFFDLTPRTYQISFLTAEADAGRHFMPHLAFDLLDPDFNKVTFTLASIGNQSGSDVLKGLQQLLGQAASTNLQTAGLPMDMYRSPGGDDNLNVDNGVTFENKGGIAMTITAPPVNSKIHFWGSVDAYTLAGLPTYTWTPVPETISTFGPQDISLDDLTLDPGGATAFARVQISDGGTDPVVTFTFKIMRLK